MDAAVSPRLRHTSRLDQSPMRVEAAGIAIAVRFSDRSSADWINEVYRRRSRSHTAAGCVLAPARDLKSLSTGQGTWFSRSKLPLLKRGELTMAKFRGDRVAFGKPGIEP